VRGGSWHDTPDACRSAARARYDAAQGDDFVGFRVVWQPEQT
jgi:formylglycine-generating enzyme required for sulfatase activity